jgi:NAD(P)-dependent dehydrogenase (short-subunit alcohol dehydrogenase family)
MTEPMVLVTGSTDWIGEATARELASRSARVILHGRDYEKGHAILPKLERETGIRILELVTADLSSQKNVLWLAEEVASRHGHLDVLINNAGVFERTRNTTPDGVEMTFAVNYLATFLLTRHLLPLLKKSSPSRVVNVSSIAHRDTRHIDLDNLQGERHYDPCQAYALSKFGIITFTYCLAGKIVPTGINVNCLHPGVTDTKMLRDGFPGVRGQSPVEGAATSVFLVLSSEAVGVTGRYFEESREPGRSSPLTYEREVQKRLWRIAEELTGMR